MPSHDEIRLLRQLRLDVEHWNESGLELRYLREMLETMEELEEKFPVGDDELVYIKKNIPMLTRRQRQIAQLMKEGWEIRTEGRTAQLERKGDQPRRLSWEMAQRMVVAAVIAPVCYVRGTGATIYKLAEQVDEPHTIL